MFRTSIVRSTIFGLGVALIATGCTPENLSGPQTSLSPPNATVTSTVAPTPGPTASLLGSVVQLTGTVVQTVDQTVSSLLYPVVQRQTALARPITVTQTIGTAGGSIAIPAAGFTIKFARGAVLQSTRITVTADSGKAISYEFGPHGIQFYAPVTITQDMSLTTLVNDPGAASGIRGGYTANGLLDIINGLLAHVAELLKATTTIVIGADGQAHLGTSSFIIKHFSGYILIST
jgi:hypothetical protein